MKSKLKILIIISSIVLFIFMFIYSFSPQKNNDTTPTPLPSQLTLSTTNIPSKSLSPTEINIASDERNKLKSSLPIYIENFTTSNNITTTINIYTLSEDPDYYIHLDIYGIIYENQNIDSNPNAIAFKESFLEAKKRLNSLNINPSNLYYVFGTREYIQSTSLYWVNEMKLLNN